MNKWLALALVVTTSGCPDITVDKDETAADPIVEFDPGNSIVPFPNNLLLNPETGKVNIPAGCNESAATKATRELVLNQLDGFGTFETAMSVTLTKPIDMASVTADNIVLYKSASDPSASNPIPILVLPGSSIRYKNQTKNSDGTVTCDTPNPIDSITIIPKIPLEQKSNYIVALKSGLKSMDGEDYVASFTWSLVRQKDNPVTVENGVVLSDRTPLDPSTDAGLAQLLGINLLWNAHATVMTFLEAKGHSRSDVLLAWSFKTQTTVDGLDAAVTGTPLTQLNNVEITGPMGLGPAPVSLVAIAQLPASRAQLPFSACAGNAAFGTTAEANDTQCLLKMILGTGAFPPLCADQTACDTAFAGGVGRCQILGCANVGDVMTGRIASPQFQVARPNAAIPAKTIPGPWSDPTKPAKVADEQLNALMMIPTGTMPAAGWPVALLQHGLGQSTSSIFAGGGQLARDPDGAGAGTGFATIAINAVAHGDRRVQISNTGTCATQPLASSCFAGFLSPDLGTTRDNIRQTVVDHLQVIETLKNKCTGGPNNCGAFKIDPAHIVYIGQSLGGIMGGMTTALSPDIKASVLNVPGIGWADIFENTQTLDIRCTLVDGLIDAGTLMGDKRDTKGTATEADDTGLCIGQEWKNQPGYKQFAAIGRWVLDPGDPANYVAKLAAKKTVIQQVVNDTVVPNVATMNEAALMMRTSATAGTNTSLATPTVSPAITTMPTSSKYVLYNNVPPNLAAGFPGNTYSHGSLLSPAASVNGAMGTCSQTSVPPNIGPQFCDGVLGTIQMVVDAITFLQINK